MSYDIEDMQSDIEDLQARIEPLEKLHDHLSKEVPVFVASVVDALPYIVSQLREQGPAVDQLRKLIPEVRRYMSEANLFSSRLEEALEAAEAALPPE